jgi:hypothetical protein
MAIHAKITPNQADTAGRLLLAIADSQAEGHNLHTVGVTTALDMTSVSNIRKVGDALHALGNVADLVIVASADDWDEMKRSAEETPTPVFKTARTVADVEDMPAYIREHFEEQDRITEVWDDDWDEMKRSAEETPTPVFKTARIDKSDPEVDPFETATVYITKGSFHGWTFRAHYEGGEVTKLFETLEDGLREHSGDILYFTEPEPDRYEVRALKNTTAGTFYRVWSNSEGRYMDGSFGSEETAETWKSVLERAEGVPECDLSPESVFEIDALAADRIGQFLNDLASFTGNDLHQITFEVMRDVPRYLRCQIGDALRELSGDPSAMIVQEELRF